VPAAWRLRVNARVAVRSVMRTHPDRTGGGGEVVLLQPNKRMKLTRRRGKRGEAW
jgi:hypothetical protein